MFIAWGNNEVQNKVENMVKNNSEIINYLESERLVQIYKRSSKVKSVSTRI